MVTDAAGAEIATVSCFTPRGSGLEADFVAAAAGATPGARPAAPWEDEPLADALPFVDTWLLKCYVYVGVALDVLLALLLVLLLLLMLLLLLLLLMLMSTWVLLLMLL